MSRGVPKDPTPLEDTIREQMPEPRPDLALPVMPERAERLLGLLEGMDAFVLEFDVAGRVVYASPNIEQILGFPPEACVASNHIEIHPDDVQEVIAAGTKVRTTGRPAHNHTRARHRDGHWVWLATTVAGWHAEETGAFRTITFHREITALKEAEAAQQESETRYAVVSRMSRDLIIETDVSGQPCYIGPGSEEIFGYSPEEMIRLDAWSMMHPEDVPRIRAMLAAEFSRGAPDDDAPRLMAFRAKTRDGRWLRLEALGHVYTRRSGERRYLSVTRDVSERWRAEEARRQLEESMRRAQRLESLGVLAGGIAHDFNNLLTPILGAAGLALEELPEDSPVRERLRTITRAGRRAAALTDQMLAYAGQRPLRIERVDLSRLVREIRDLVASSISGKTTFALELAPELPAVEGGAAQLSQVVLNLVTNASESLGDGAGQVTVRTGTVFLDAAPADVLFAETLEPGPHLYFEVEDAGTGMDPETASKIFDPFFTTKFTGRGLGLAAVAGIVRAHRGAIQVSTEPGRGTRFRVLLPAAPGDAAEAEPVQSSALDWRGAGTALVIDDDDEVRELAAVVLRRAGMQVLTAADGHDGLKLFDQYGDTIRVVLLDRTLPVHDGADTVAAIRAARPEARIILVSGYSREHATADLADGDAVSFLQKPFDPDTLLARVRDALES